MADRTLSTNISLLLNLQKNIHKHLFHKILIYLAMMIQTSL